MAIPKVYGVETEYGITSVGERDFNPVLASSLLISGYAGSLRRIRWDFEQESPLRDARSKHTSSPRSFSDDDVGLANVMLRNGARYYVDHAHPEYSTPECSTPRELIAHDRAGERILERSLAEYQTTLGPSVRVAIYKNNSDGKGNSYGTHENYLVDRALPFADLVRDFTPYLVTRQVFTGAGKVGSESDMAPALRPRFQLSQRADFFEAEVGLETTLKRPIINTRDEPHADADRYRRLHVIIGDANLCEVATLLKIGTASLVLRMSEDAFLPDLSLADPVAALKTISADPTCTAQVHLRDGRSLSAVQMQWEYLERAAKYVEQEGLAEGDREVLDRWETTLVALEDEPLKLSRELDWVAKYRLLEGYRQRDQIDWHDPKLRLVDLQYHDVRRDRGLYHRLVASGAVERLVSDDEVDRAIEQPPTTTRAWFRGGFIRRFESSIVAASWDSLTVDTGSRALQRIPMLEPLKGTSEHVDALFAEAADAAGLVDALTDGGVGGGR